MYKFIIFALVVLLLLIFINRENSKIKYYDFYPYLRYPKFRSPSNHPNQKSVCFIAGVHGNEPAGTKALEDLLKTGYFQEAAQSKNLNIRVIPAINEWGLSHNIRYQLNPIYPDINRNFLGEGLDETSKEIIDLIKDYDLVVDFHEGWGFHLINHRSVGSTLSPGNTKMSLEIASRVIDKINESIVNPNKKFILLLNRSCEIPKTLSCYRENKQKNYILVETSGQNDIQPLITRKKQIIDVVNETLKYMK